MGDAVKTPGDVGVEDVLGLEVDEGVAVSGLPLTTFPSSLPTIDDRSHAAGWRCRPGTGVVGVDVLHKMCYHCTDVDTQLSKIRVAWCPLLTKCTRNLCRPSPGLCPVSGERVAPPRSSRLLPSAGFALLRRLGRSG